MNRTKKWLGAGAALLLVATIAYAQGRKTISSTLQWDGVYQGAATTNLSAPYPGQLFVDYGDASTQPELFIHDQIESATAFDRIPGEDTTAAWTANQTFGNAQEDLYTFQGRVQHNVFRQEFEYVMYKALENDETAAVVTDASVNYLTLYSPSTHNSIPIIGYRIEAPGGPGLAATPSPGATQGIFTADGYVDDVDNEGIVFTFGNHDAATGLDDGIHFDETTSEGMYCEAQVDISNISAVDDFWFGWALNDATDNPPASADYNTGAFWTINDASGDIDTVTSLNDAGEDLTDAGTDWTDGDQFILRVEITADAVQFFSCLTDGCSSTLTETTGSDMNADNDDVLHCVVGFTNAAAESLGLTLEYIEIGEIQ